MTSYLISFGAHAMDHIPGQDMPAVARAAHAVCQEAINAGVFVGGGGLEDQRAGIVAAGGTVTGGPYPGAVGGRGSVPMPRTSRLPYGDASVDYSSKRCKLITIVTSHTVLTLVKGVNIRQYPGRLVGR